MLLLKRRLTLGTIIGFLFSFVPVELIVAAPLKVSVASDAAILMNAETGAILYDKNGKTAHYPASITKIATALYAIKMKEGKLEEEAIADQDAIGSITEEAKVNSNYKVPPYRMVVGGSHVGIKKGESMTLRALLYGLMLASGDDAANVIAQHVGGTIPKFMDEVNLYLKGIGCQQTTFLNPHGLHFPGHKTTAYDMAILTKEGLKNPTFCEIVSTVRYTRPKTNKQDATTWVQTNRLLKNGQFFYSKAIGVKTGHGSPALNTLVAAAQHEGRTLIAVLLHCKERNDTFKDAITLFDAAFQQQRMERIFVKAGPQKFALQIEGISQPVKTYVEKPISIQYYPAEEPKIKALLVWDQCKAPIKKGQRLGEIQLVNEGGVVLNKAVLLAEDDAQASWGYWFKHLLDS